MIWSVSMLGVGNGIAGALRVVNGSIVMPLALEQLAHVGELACNGGGCSHGRADEMGAHAAPLPAHEIAVRGRCDTLLRPAGVAVHADAHGAAGVTPFEACLGEDAIEPLRLRLLLDEAGP